MSTNTAVIKGPVLSIRSRSDNPFHHLWNNNGTWWIHFTEHLPNYTKRRVRRSLGTPHLHVAQQRRDAILTPGTIIADRRAA